MKRLYQFVRLSLLAGTMSLLAGCTVGPKYVGRITRRRRPFAERIMQPSRATPKSRSAMSNGSRSIASRGCRTDP